jgi:hypothetical protein
MSEVQKHLEEVFAGIGILKKIIYFIGFPAI